MYKTIGYIKIDKKYKNYKKTDFDNLSYRELSHICMQNNIKGNLKQEDMLKCIKMLIDEETPDVSYYKKSQVVELLDSVKNNPNASIAIGIAICLLMGLVFVLSMIGNAPNYVNNTRIP